MQTKSATFYIERDVFLRGIFIGREDGFFGHEGTAFVRDTEWQEFVAVVMKINQTMPGHRKWNKE